MLTTLILALGTQAPAPPRVEEWIERLKDADVAAREKAQEGILERWEAWTEADLKKLEAAAASADAEVAGRVRVILKWLAVTRSYARQLPVSIDAAGNLRIQGRACALADAFALYAKPPKDPAGKRVFTTLRIYLDADKDVPFGQVYATLSAAARTTPLAEVVLIDPAKPEEGEKLRIFSVGAQPKEDAVDWKDKFLSEVGYHYMTQQIKNGEIEELTAKVARLERELKERK